MKKTTLIITLIASAWCANAAPELTNTEATNIDQAAERQAWREALELWTDDAVTFGSGTFGGMIEASNGAGEVYIGGYVPPFPPSASAGIWMADENSTITPSNTNYTMLKTNTLLKFGVPASDSFEFHINNTKEAEVTTGGFGVTSGNYFYVNGSGSWDGSIFSGDQQFSGTVDVTGLLTANGNIEVANGASSQIGLDSVSGGGYIKGSDGLEFYGASTTKFFEIADVAGVTDFFVQANFKAGAEVGADTAVGGELRIWDSDGATPQYALVKSAAALAANRTYTIPDAGGAADFVMTAGSQSITGQKTIFGANLNINESAAGAMDAALAMNGLEFYMENTWGGNMFLGTVPAAIPTDSSAYYNMGIGIDALSGISGGANQNVAVGYASGSAVTAGYHNTMLGNRAGDTITTGNSNTLLGNEADVSAVGATNRIAVGYNALATVDNTAQIGNSSMTKLTVGTVGDAVLTGGNQTIAGAKTYTGSIVIGGFDIATPGADQWELGSAYAETVLKADASVGALYSDYELYLGTPTIAGSIQLNDGSTHRVNIRPSAFSADRTYFIPDVGSNADFVMDAGNQTIGGDKTFTGNTAFDKTITAAGTTGAQTINKNAGSVNFAAAATSLVVTNSRVTANSVIICTIGTNDATMTSVQAVASAGSFTIYANAAATAETRVNFIVIN